MPDDNPKQNESHIIGQPEYTRNNTLKKVPTVPVPVLESLIEDWREAAESASEMAEKEHSNTSLFLGIKATREFQADELEQAIDKHNDG